MLLEVIFREPLKEESQLFMAGSIKGSWVKSGFKSGMNVDGFCSLFLLFIKSITLTIRLENIIRNDSKKLEL